MREKLIYAACILFALMLVRRFQGLGGPYFTFPETIQDHVRETPYPSRDAILLAEHAATVIPRGKKVTVLRPSEAPNYDLTLFYAATGLMPRHLVVAPDLDSPNPPDYVISVHEPLNHPAYRMHVELEKGFIYSRK
ncbi:MAG TPA: hypothetical protein VNA69_00305 [Thermoanaerobaculia bacterium]|nr:hypothetical protein [Thermoanaerobaculia bacterium]